MLEDQSFNTPQRLNSLGYLINIAKTSVKIIKQFFFLIAYMIYKYRDILYSKYVWLIIVGLLLLVAIIAFINFRTFKYYVDQEAEEFVVQKGLISKSKVVIKFANILQVNITQNVVQKVLSLYGLTLDTAGSDKIEVDLYALDGFHATELKKLLLSKIHGESQGTPYEDKEILTPKASSEITVLSLPSKNIFLVSLFSNYRQGLALFVAFLGTMFQHLKDAIETFDLSDEDINTAAVEEFAVGSMVVFIFLMACGLISIPFIINIFRYFIKYYNFTIVKNASGNFSMQYGLANKVNTIFNSEKIQVITFKRNQIVKRLGLGILSLKQLVRNDSKEDKSTVEMPGIAFSDRDQVYEMAFNDAVFQEYQILKPKIGLLINRLLKMIGVFVAIYLIIIFFEVDNSLLYPFLGIGIMVITLYNYLYYASYRLLYNDNFLIKRDGVWNEKEIVIPMTRLQSVEVSQTIFQKTSGTANLHLSTAASEQIQFIFFAQEQVNQLSNYLLFIVEK